MEDLQVGDKLTGPAILADGTQTIVVTPNASALVIKSHVVINIGEDSGATRQINTEVVDPIMLSIFGHRFMSIAEQMGTTLQKTSVSTNVKERLDYSCALFDSDGGLVANGKMSSPFTVISNLLTPNKRLICRYILAVCPLACPHRPRSGKTN